MLELIQYANDAHGLNWEIIDTEEVDTKVGNGHTVVARVHHPTVPDYSYGKSIVDDLSPMMVELNALEEFAKDEAYPFVPGSETVAQSMAKAALERDAQTVRPSAGELTGLPFTDEKPVEEAPTEEKPAETTKAKGKGKTKK